jgi:hypothetical protein
VAGFLLLGGAFTAWFVVFIPLHKEALDNDLTLVYIGARIGLEQGWSHIYSLNLQHRMFTELRPAAAFNDGERFLSPPPFAWLVAPLSAFGPAGATYLWLALSVTSLVAAWWMAAPATGLIRALWLLAAFAWYPVQYSLSLAQPAVVVLVAVIACWVLAERGRPYLAGIVLGLSVIKPQLVVALPLVLLAAGRWKIAAAWAATVAVAALVSVIVIGQQGVGDYRALLAEAQNVTNNRYFTSAFVLGAGPAGYAWQGLVLVAGVAGAFLNRTASLARLFALGLVATAIGATYWHLQDYAILVGAVWLFWRTGPPAWQLWWLLVVAVGGELAWPLTPLPILVGLTGWLVVLAMPDRPRPRAALAAAR